MPASVTSCAPMLTCCVALQLQQLPRPSAVLPGSSGYAAASASPPLAAVSYVPCYSILRRLEASVHKNVATDIETELTFMYNGENEKASGPSPAAPRLEITGQIGPMLL